VVHRDIKPENFLLGAPTLLMAPAGSAAAVLKVSDFGVSAFYTPGEVCYISLLLQMLRAASAEYTVSVFVRSACACLAWFALSLRGCARYVLQASIAPTAVRLSNC
jgi:serine/threonine protein kinase